MNWSREESGYYLLDIPNFIGTLMRKRMTKFRVTITRRGEEFIIEDADQVTIEEQEVSE